MTDYNGYDLIVLGAKIRISALTGSEKSRPIAILKIYDSFCERKT